MKKTKSLKWMALGLMLTAGNLTSWADETPATGTKVGATVEITISTEGGVETKSPGLVVYEVVAGGTSDRTPVKITGLDRDGLEALGNAKKGELQLIIPTDFKEKYGTTTNHYYVTSIEDGWNGVEEAKHAFYGYPQIGKLEFQNQKVVPSNSFTFTVGKYAFYGCTGMTVLKFSDNVSSIGEYAFQNTSIKDFIIPAKCATIATNAFYNCQSLNSVKVENTNEVMTTIGDFVFGNSTLKILDLKKAVNFKSFGNKPFLYGSNTVNHQLEEVYLPNSFTTLNTAFHGCTGLQKINLEDTKVTAVNSTNGFIGCSSLPELTIPQTATVEGTPFAGAVKLAKLTFKATAPATINNKIGDGTNNLYTVTTGTDKEKEASLAALKELVFDGLFTATIDDNAFVGCTSLEKVSFKGEMRAGAKIKGAFTDDEALATLEMVGINGNTTFDKDAFKNTGITTLTIPAIKSGNVAFNDGSFSDMKALTAVEFEDMTTTGVVNINNDGAGKGAFNNNPLLASVKFGAINKGTLNIEEDAFVKNDALANVSFGAIGLNTTPSVATTVNIKEGAFINNPALAEVSFDAIKDTDDRKTNVNIGEDTDGTGLLVFGPTVKKVSFKDITAKKILVGDNAFKSDALEEVTFGNIKTEALDFGQSAFEGNSVEEDYQKVTFGTITNFKNQNNAFNIWDNAFKGGLKDVTFGSIFDESTTSTKFNTINIEASAFEGTKSITFNQIAANTVNIKANAFKGAKLEAVDFKSITNVKSGFSVNLNISGYAFEGNDLVKKTVTFGEISMKDYNNNVNINIADNAFEKGNYKVTFDKIAAKNLIIGKQAFKSALLEEVSFAAEKTIATVNFSIDDEAFLGDNLNKVTFGDIVSLKNSASTTYLAGTYTIGKATPGFGGAFQSGNAPEKAKEITFGNITQADGVNTKAAVGNALTVNISDNAFLNGVKKVAFGNISATTFNIGKNAFQSSLIEEVEFKNILTTTFAIDDNAFENTKGATAPYAKVTFGEIKPFYVDGTATIGQYAFKGGVKDVVIANFCSNTKGSTTLNLTNAEMKLDAFNGTKTVKIGESKTINAQTLIIGATTFQGDDLESVTIGNLNGANTLEIGTSAFSGGKLATVKLGNIQTYATKCEIGAQAFQNTSTEKMDEAITIGNLASTKLDILANAFEAAQADGSSLELKIGDIASKPNTVATNAFKAAPVGKANFTLGNIAADVSNVAAGAFAGSQDENGDNTTILKTGNYKNKFVNGAFTNVNTVTTGNWNENAAAGFSVAAFGGANEITVGEIPDGVNLISGNVTPYTDNITTLNFTGSIAKEGVSTGTIGIFNSTKIRKITFAEASEECEVHTGAVAAGAFVAASDAAGTLENISIIYKVDEMQARYGHKIFDLDAFGTTTTPANVTLYTTTWAKDNIFESPNPALLIKRLVVSASDIIPGEDIFASVVKVNNSNYAFGKFYLPAGTGKFKISTEDGNVNVFEGRIDFKNNENYIYMKQLDVIEGNFWIDASDMDQVFVVRAKGKATGDKVNAETVTAEEEAEMVANLGSEFYWYEKSDGKKNSLKYTATGVVNQELQNNDTYRTKNIYVMANPATQGFKFAWLDQFGTSRALAKGSLYVLGKQPAASRDLKVIWEDETIDSEVTGIENIEVASDTDAIYNLQGVRVQSAKKGAIYVKNGKKFVK